MPGHLLVVLEPSVVRVQKLEVLYFDIAPETENKAC
jgi:hypothetical protein